MHQEQGGPRYSIVVPAYNEAAYVGRALTSLQQQDFNGPYEIVVVDNNSTDDTAAVAASYGVQVEHEPQQGVCAARQRGVDASHGDIVVSVDADTIYPSNWLSTIDARFAESPDTVAVAGPCRYQNPSWWAKAFPEVLFGLVAGIFAITGLVLYVSATNIAIRRSAFPGYDLHLTQGGDELDLLRRLRRRGPVVWVRHNVVSTSARRMQRGLIYNLFVSGFVYYFLGYLLNRLFAHRTIGMAPAFRPGAKLSESLPRPRRRVMVTLMVLGVTTLGLATYAGPEAFARVVDFWKSP
jgi:glycosyltransferase involved in cell wall biosynthesis